MKTILGLDVFQKRPPKPRSRGITIMRDCGVGFRTAQDIVESVGEFVDYVKLRHFYILRAQEEEDLTLRKARLYRENQIEPFVGGVVFELAHLRGCVERTFERLVGMGFTTMEISDNMIDISLKVKADAVRKACAAGLRAVFEFGKKYGDAPLEVAPAAEEMDTVLEAGAEHVIIERTELENLLGPKGEKPEAERLPALAERVGVENLIFEAETADHISWMIKTFGPDVNLGPNLDHDRICRIEALRHGFGREVGYFVVEPPK